LDAAVIFPAEEHPFPTDNRKSNSEKRISLPKTGGPLRGSSTVKAGQIRQRPVLLAALKMVAYLSGVVRVLRGCPGIVRTERKESGRT